MNMTLRDKVLAKMIELKEFDKSTLIGSIKTINAPMLDILRAVDSIINSSLVESNFDYYRMRI